MFKPKPNDDTESIIAQLIGVLTDYSEKCPNLSQYIFCIENEKWAAKPKYPLSFPREEGYYLRNLRKLFEYIDCNFQKEIPERFAANTVGLSVPEFCRFFGKQTGMTFVSYKNKVRIERAVPMLTETDSTCEQIAWDCGFTSYHYFKRVFEKHCGVSPAKFRAEQSERNVKNKYCNEMK